MELTPLIFHFERLGSTIRTKDRLLLSTVLEWELLAVDQMLEKLIETLVFWQALLWHVIEIFGQFLIQLHAVGTSATAKKILRYVDLFPIIYGE